MPPFHFPYYLNTNFRRNNYYKNRLNLTQESNLTSDLQNKNANSSNLLKSKKNNSKSDYDNYFFELFGLKLYFDDVLLMSILFFLYEEGVKDNELFFSLILLLLS